MSDPLDAELTKMAAKCDAMTWVIAQLMASHPDLARVAASWHAQSLLEKMGGLDTHPGDYAAAYLEELNGWTAALEGAIHGQRNA